MDREQFINDLVKLKDSGLTFNECKFALLGKHGVMKSESVLKDMYNTAKYGRDGVNPNSRSLSYNKMLRETIIKNNRAMRIKERIKIGDYIEAKVNTYDIYAISTKKSKVKVIGVYKAFVVIENKGVRECVNYNDIMELYPS